MKPWTEKEEAEFQRGVKSAKRFKHYCQCGGYAWRMNGRPQEQPHMAWCPQAAEYAEWWRTEGAENKSG